MGILMSKLKENIDTKVKIYKRSKSHEDFVDMMNQILINNSAYNYHSPEYQDKDVH